MATAETEVAGHRQHQAMYGSIQQVFPVLVHSGFQPATFCILLKLSSFTLTYHDADVNRKNSNSQAYLLMELLN